MIHACVFYHNKKIKNKKRGVDDNELLTRGEKRPFRKRSAGAQTKNRRLKTLERSPFCIIVLEM